MTFLSLFALFHYFNYMINRKDHIAKIDTAQKYHNEKWGFLKDIQPTVCFDDFLFFCFSFVY